MLAGLPGFFLSHILHHSQQDLKNRVSQRRIKVFRLQQSQETRFLALVQDLSCPSWQVPFLQVQQHFA
jgi:hypothetical protein